MTRYFLLLIIFFSIACTTQEKNEIVAETTLQSQFKRQTVYNWENGQPIYSLLLPNDWFLNPYSEENQPYISVGNDYTITRKIEKDYFAFSDKPNLVEKAKVGGKVTDKTYTIDDIVQLEIAPKLTAQGFQLKNKYPLDIINNQSLYFHNSIYIFPEKINTIATEWQNDSGQSILCLIELITNPTLFANSGSITTFNYNAEILKTESTYFEDFKNSYLSVCRSYILEEEYITQNLQANQLHENVWRNQMVVRSDEEYSYLTSREWHNRDAYRNWKADQICMGILVDDPIDSYIATDEEYNPDSNFVDTDWKEVY